MQKHTHTQYPRRTVHRKSIIRWSTKYSSSTLYYTFCRIYKQNVLFWVYCIYIMMMADLDNWNMSQCIIKCYCTIVVFGWIINTLFINTHLDDVTPNCLSVDFNQHQDTKINVFFSIYCRTLDALSQISAVRIYNIYLSYVNRSHVLN